MSAQRHERAPDSPATIRFPTKDRPEVTAGEVVRAYLDSKRAEIKAGLFDDKSFKKLDHYLDSFLEWIGTGTPSAALVNGDLRRWMLSHPEWAASNTKNDAAGSLCSCWNWAAKTAEIVDRCPFSRPRGLIAPPEPLPPTEIEEVGRVLKTAQRHQRKGTRRRPSAAAFRAGLFFITHTGARTKEMRIVRIEWIDWRQRILIIPKEHNKIRRKANQPRLIPLPVKVARLLWWICRGRTEGLIFLNGRRKPWKCRAFADQWREYARMSGISDEKKAYACRHGWTCRALEAGLTPKEAGDILGHTGGRTVERVYGASTRFRAERLSRLSDSLEKPNKPGKTDGIGKDELAGPENSETNTPTNE